GLSSANLADPNTVTQGPTKCSTRNPRMNSSMIDSISRSSRVLDLGPSRKICSLCGSPVGVCSSGKVCLRSLDLYEPDDDFRIGESFDPAVFSKLVDPWAKDRQS